MEFVYAVLLGLIIIVVLIDIVPFFNTWQSRIYIGRWSNVNDWIFSVEKKSMQWLRKTPTIRLTDNSRLIIIDKLKGNYRRNAIQYWQEAALVMGLSQSYNATKDENIRNSINDYVDSKITIKGNWKDIPTHIDAGILAYSLIKLEWINHLNYKPAYDAVYDVILNHIGNDATIMYRKHMKEYRYVDTIGFICPFLMAYGLKFNNSHAVELAIKQIVEFNKIALLTEEFIPCHTYHIETKLPVGLFGWGRGLAWYAIGLIDSWTELPDDHVYKQELTDMTIKFARMAIKFQNSNGSWSWLVTSKESQSDSSTTAVLAWFLTIIANHNLEKEESIKAIDKAKNYLKSVTKRTGEVDLSQGDTKGIGIHSVDFNILPFTQGFCLRLLRFNG